MKTINTIKITLIHTFNLIVFVLVINLNVLSIYAFMLIVISHMILFFKKLTADVR